MVTTWIFHMVVYFKANLHYEKRNLSPKIYFQTYECFSQLYTEGEARIVNFFFENSTGHKIEFSVHVTLAKMKSAICIYLYIAWLGHYLFNQNIKEYIHAIQI